MRLRVVREFNLPDTVADLLEVSALYNNLAVSRVSNVLITLSAQLIVLSRNFLRTSLKLFHCINEAFNMQSG